MAIGGYTTAILSVTAIYGTDPRPLDDPDRRRRRPASPACSSGFRRCALSGLYLALVTFGIAVSFRQVPSKFDHFLGGTSGKVLSLLKTPFGLSATPNNWLYYLTWGIAFVLLVVAWLFVRGKPGGR
jgi:ABC-type branched-subunit amino acid transport system permease subunit